MSQSSDSLHIPASLAPTFDPSALFSAGSIVPPCDRADDQASESKADGKLSSERVLAWMDMLAAAPHRTAGIEIIGSILAFHFADSESPAGSAIGGVAARVVVGTKSPKRIYDHRLGWLSRDSTLWTRATSHWSASSFDGQWTEVAGDKTAPAEFLIGFDPGPRSSQRLLVWISTANNRTIQTDAIQSTLAICARFIPRLPKRSAPTWTLLFGKHPLWTLGFLGLILIIGLAFPVPYPVSCTARVEPIGERMVAAPFDATLLECRVRPGDHVSKDQVLVELDGRPLRLEREALKAESDHALKEREVALASRRIADAQQAELKQRQLERRVQLIDDRLARLQVRSPIQGVVVSGDLERFVGSPLETGQTLLEIAPLDRLSIEIEIPEYEIGYVASNATARIRFAAAGGRSMQANLQSVSPAAEIRDDSNVFVGRIELDQPDENLRPRMQGDASLYGPRRPLVWRLGRAVWERTLWWIGY